jgi:hypothetical protein
MKHLIIALLLLTSIHSMGAVCSYSLSAPDMDSMVKSCLVSALKKKNYSLKTPSSLEIFSDLSWHESENTLRLTLQVMDRNRGFNQEVEVEAVNPASAQDGCALAFAAVRKMALCRQ